MDERTRAPQGAIIEGPYRYLLWRTWDASRPSVLWVLLNPSVGDAERDSATLRRCIGFSAAWGYGGLEVVNLFAFRTPSPVVLRRARDPIGPKNDAAILDARGRVRDVLVAWGSCGTYRARDREVLALLARGAARSPRCLDLTASGSPRHPLYVARRAVPIAFSTLASNTSNTSDARLTR